MGLKQKLSDLFRLGEIKDTFMELIDAKFQLKKLEIQEQVEKGLIELLYLLFQGAIILVCSIFALILLALGINFWLGSPYGYVIVLVLCLIGLGIFRAYKKAIKENIKNRITREVDAISQ